MSDASSSETALVLFSGGQDSTTCLAWALQRFARVETLGFDYGQRHAIELACRDRLFDGHQAPAHGLGCQARREPHAVDPDAGGRLRDRADARRRDRDGRRRPAEHLRARPQSGVSDLRRGAGLPARHHVTSSAACARPTIPAIPIAATTPSRRCRPRSILGMARKFELHTPLMWLDKAATWKLAHDLGGAGWSISSASTRTPAISANAARSMTGAMAAASARPAPAREGLAGVRGGTVSVITPPSSSAKTGDPVSETIS